MCKDCRHWKTFEGFESHGLRFAPCALKPDKVIQDRRVHGGRDLQSYVTEATYECAKFQSQGVAG